MEWLIVNQQNLFSEKVKMQSQLNTMVTKDMLNEAMKKQKDDLNEAMNKQKDELPNAIGSLLDSKQRVLGQQIQLYDRESQQNKDDSRLQYINQSIQSQSLKHETNPLKQQFGDSSYQPPPPLQSESQNIRISQKRKPL